MPKTQPAGSARRKHSVGNALRHAMRSMFGRGGNLERRTRVEVNGCLLWRATTNRHLPSAAHTCVGFATPAQVRNAACDAPPIGHSPKLNLTSAVLFPHGESRAGAGRRAEPSA